MEAILKNCIHNSKNNSLSEILNSLDRIKSKILFYKVRNSKSNYI